MLTLYYIYWHYAVAPGEILKLLKNYLIGTWHKFFISKHLRTLISPWHRLRASDVIRAEKIIDKLGNILVDIYTRFLAALIRLSIILTGLIAEIIVVIFFAALFIGWLLWPVIFVISIWKGLMLLA
jgi:hypothetical protein